MATKKNNDKGVTQCAAGTVLFREGDPGDKMYVIKSGRIQITKRVFGTNVVIEELKGGDFCGEIALVNDQARPVTAVVVREASVIPIDSKQFENMVRSNADIAVRMLKRLSQRLTEAQFRISNFTLRQNKARLMHQLRHEALGADSNLRTPAPIPDDLADVLSLEVGEIKILLGELMRDQLISIDKHGTFEILDPRSFERQLNYLELRDHFEYRD